MSTVSADRKERGRGHHLPLNSPTFQSERSSTLCTSATNERRSPRAHAHRALHSPHAIRALGQFPKLFSSSKLVPCESRSHPEARRPALDDVASSVAETLVPLDVAIRPWNKSLARFAGLTIDAGWSSLVARRAHNPKVAGSNPAPATNNGADFGRSR